MLLIRMVASPSVVFFFIALLPLLLARNPPLPPLDGMITSNYYGHHHHPSFEPAQLSLFAPPFRGDRGVVVNGGGAIAGSDGATGITGRERLPPPNRATRVLRRLLDHARGILEDGRSRAEDNNARLRRDLLQGYDRGSFPWDWARNVSGTKIDDVFTDNEDADTNPYAESSSASARKGLKVEVGINFHRIVDVNVQESTFDALVWFRMTWTDPRFVWDPLSYGGIKSTTFWIGSEGGPGDETSEIWTPDIMLWNQNEGLASSLTPQSAIVNSEGVISWSRPGHLCPMCKFRGLEDFPFDTLECDIEIGSWTRSGEYLLPVQMAGDYNQEVGAAGESLGEFQMVKQTSREYLYSDSIIGKEWPSLIYTVVLSRAS